MVSSQKVDSPMVVSVLWRKLGLSYGLFFRLHDPANSTRPDQIPVFDVFYRLASGSVFKEPRQRSRWTAQDLFTQRCVRVWESSQ